MTRELSKRRGFKNPVAMLGDDVRVGIYVRRSTDDEHQPYSIDAQDSRLDAYIHSQPGWRLVARFHDDASGATTKRQGLIKAIEAANSGQIDVLLVYRVDRFSRNLRDMVTLLDELDSADVVFRSATEPFDTATPMGRMLVQMLGMFAQFERDTIIDRTIAGMERKAAKGKWKGGRRPFGYRPDPSTQVLVVEESEAAIVRAVFALYTADKLGTRAVAEVLNDRGHRTTNGGKWSGYQITRMLTNRIYLGELTFRGVTVTSAHQPIIATDIWKRAERILTARGDNPGYSASTGFDYLLAGRLRCPRCNRSMVGTRANGRTRSYRYYTCWTRSRYTTAKCDQPRMDADAVDRAVLDALVSFYSTQRGLIQDAVGLARGRHQAKHGDRRAELAAVDAELSKCAQSIDRYLAAFERGSLDGELLSERLAELRASAGRLRDRRDGLAQALDDVPEAPASEALDDVVTDIGDVIRTGNNNQVKALIEALVAGVTIAGPNRLIPTFRVPKPPSDDETAGQNAKTAPEGAVRTLTRLGWLTGLEPATPRITTWCSTS